MVDLQLVLPPLNLFTLDAGILVTVEHVRLMMFSLKMEDYSMRTSRGDLSETFLLFRLLFKVKGGWPPAFSSPWFWVWE